MSVCVCLWMDLQGCVEEVGDKRYTRQPPGSTFITGQKPDRSDIVHLMKLLSMLTKRVKGVNTETNYMTFCNLGKVEQTPWPRWKGLRKVEAVQTKMLFCMAELHLLSFLPVDDIASSKLRCVSRLHALLHLLVCSLSPQHHILVSRTKKCAFSRTHIYGV